MECKKNKSLRDKTTFFKVNVRFHFHAKDNLIILIIARMYFQMSCRSCVLTPFFKALVTVEQF